MDLGLKGRVAIVSASSKGLGKAVAKGLAEEGARVVMCARGAEALTQASEEIRLATGAEVLPILADVTRPGDIQKVVGETLVTWGRIDILFTNGGGPPILPFEEVPEPMWQEAIELVLMSTIRMIREVLPTMKRARFGRIIANTSVAVKQPVEGFTITNAVRETVLGLAKSLSFELAPYNITVNTVCPGYTMTDRFREAVRARARREGISAEEALQAIEREVPMGRVGDPEEFANLVVFLASERASYITGTAVQVDGGFVRSLF